MLELGSRYRPFLHHHQAAHLWASIRCVVCPTNAYITLNNTLSRRRAPCSPMRMTPQLMISLDIGHAQLHNIDLVSNLSVTQQPFSTTDGPDWPLPDSTKTSAYRKRNWCYGCYSVGMVLDWCWLWIFWGGWHVSCSGIRPGLGGFGYLTYLKYVRTSSRLWGTCMYIHTLEICN